MTVACDDAFVGFFVGLTSSLSSSFIVSSANSASSSSSSDSTFLAFAFSGAASSFSFSSCLSFSSPLASVVGFAFPVVTWGALVVLGLSAGVVGFLFSFPFLSASRALSNSCASFCSSILSFPVLSWPPSSSISSASSSLSLVFSEASSDRL